MGMSLLSQDFLEASCVQGAPAQGEDSNIAAIIDGISEQAADVPGEGDGFNDVMVRVCSSGLPSADFATYLWQAEEFCNRDGLFDWLPYMPKALFERTPDHVLSEIYLDTHLVRMFTAFRTCSLGLKILVISCSQEDSFVVHRLIELEATNAKIVDKIYNAVLSLTHEVPPDVQKSVVPMKVFQLENHEKHMRNLILYCCFLNCVQFLLDCLLDIRFRIQNRLFKDFLLYASGVDTDLAPWENPGRFVLGAPPSRRPLPSRHQQVDAIVELAESALAQAGNLHDEYCSRCYHRRTSEMVRSSLSFSFQWMPHIPKLLHEDLPETALASLDYEKLLLECYHALQTCYVGLEVCRREQSHISEHFSDSFLHAEIKNRSVLVEMQMALFECGLPATGVDVRRTVMPMEHRRQDIISANKYRGFIVLRDYLNTLEYLIEGMKYVRDNGRFGGESHLLHEPCVPDPSCINVDRSFSAPPAVRFFPV